ncbi:MAG: hypothetical protein JWR38_4881 [Mucilaginibacter sp.]|nr:hypothetical protein [Mucilaginibacter sp.]
MDSEITIQAIDTIVSAELLKLNSIAELLNFEKICEFELKEDINEICDKSHSYPGIYFFEIKNTDFDTDTLTWMNAFTALWKDKDYHKQWVPGIKKIRVRAHTQITDWIPLYIGKSKNVGSRINEHLLKDLDKTTFAMKLKARKNLYGKTFRVQALKMDVINYDVIVPHLESVLRNKWNPIVGKQ